MNDSAPILGTIKVERDGPFGIAATVNGRRRSFPNLEAVFRAAVCLLDGEEREPPRRPPPPERSQS